MDDPVVRYVILFASIAVVAGVVALAKWWAEQVGRGRHAEVMRGLEAMERRLRNEIRTATAPIRALVAAEHRRTVIGSDPPSTLVDVPRDSPPPSSR